MDDHLFAISYDIDSSIVVMGIQRAAKKKKLIATEAPLPDDTVTRGGGKSRRAVITRWIGNTPYHLPYHLSFSVTCPEARKTLDASAAKERKWV